MKTYCGVCGKKTEQEEVRDEIAPGVYIRSTKCRACGEEWTAHEELRRAKEELKKLGYTRLRRKLGKVGEALILRIPKDIQEQMNLKAGDYVDLYTTKNEVRMKVKAAREG